jgi:hypothetical protein
MPLSNNTTSLEAALHTVLAEHFDNGENPHETISRIWLLLNAVPLADFPPPGDHRAKATYN